MDTFDFGCFLQQLTSLSSRQLHKVRELVNSLPRDDEAADLMENPTAAGLACAHCAKTHIHRHGYAKLDPVDLQLLAHRRLEAHHWILPVAQAPRRA